MGALVARLIWTAFGSRRPALQDMSQPQDYSEGGSYRRHKRARVASDLSEGVDHVDTHNVYSGQVIGILTSGGDSQGMNAAVRAVVRVATSKGCRVFGIKEGFQGLVDNLIEELSWQHVSGIMKKGGTVLGTARCDQFRQREGRLIAAKNMVEHGINNLVVVGGDGSLTGANVFREEWQGLLKELVEKKELNERDIRGVEHLNIIGMVGSIDNDFCGTDITIGTDSALHRIVEAVDAITSTAASHQRSFVLEVMGRHCGYLALMSSLAVGADWVFIPEDAPSEGWELKMCAELQRAREGGRRYSLVIVSEGAMDKKGGAITSQYVKQVIERELHHDTRITVLGHVQRGGTPSAYDRILGCRYGAEAVMALLEATPDTQSCVVAMQGNRIQRVSLMDCVKKTQEVGVALKNKDYAKALGGRGRSFANNLSLFEKLRAVQPPDIGDDQNRFTFGIMTVGAPACGMNSCIRAFVRLCLFAGHKMKAIHDSFVGLVAGRIEDFNWMSVNNWSREAGSLLGTNRDMASDCNMSLIADMLGKHGIQGLVVVGGFEAYQSVVQLAEARDQFSEFRIPLVCIPASISNNVPGTDVSLGTDTALNAIVEALDVLQKSASSNRRRVFVVETMGGYCGYLATLAALAGGADSAYIYEESFTIHDLQSDLTHMIGKFRSDVLRGTIVRNELCSEHYTTRFLTSLYNAEGEGLFVARELVLGHLQQGGAPSPYDRCLGARLAVQALGSLVERVTDCISDGVVNAVSPSTACVTGVVGKSSTCTPVQELKTTTDFKHRLPLDQWWLVLRPLIKVLARSKKHGFEGERYKAERDEPEASVSDWTELS